ncbi:MAG: transposase [Fodinibius sp.]|nr:transposase [Fodinibius sp.]
MAALAEEHYQQVMEALLTIPGIGKKTAIELVTVTDGFRRFDSPRKLASYVGICPRIWESGSSVQGTWKYCRIGLSATAEATVYVQLVRKTQQPSL